MSEYVDLLSLPTDHRLRNAPLVSIGARYRPTSHAYGWQIVGSHYIASKSFNDLGEAWTNDTEWQAVDGGEA